MGTRDAGPVALSGRMTRCFGGYGQAEEVAECIKEAHPHDAALCI